jgi:hypothetical protein
MGAFRGLTMFTKAVRILVEFMRGWYRYGWNKG